MKKITLLLGLLVASISALFAQVPMATEDVMLQAFYWNSHGETKWSQLNSQASEIAASFDLVWLPPASSAEFGGSSNMGYHPYQWSNLSSSWGDRSQLTTLIKSLHNGNCKVIADIVVNHRSGNSAQGNFPTDNFGDYGSYTIPNSCVTKDDENSNGSATDYDYKWNVAGDMWGGYSAARDLAHSKSEVRDAIKAYLKWLKNTIGFDGFRYDLVKGYDPKYTAEYNTASAPYFSVGEFYQSNYDDLAGWVNGASKKSTVFDFCFKQAMYNWGGGTDYSKLVWKDGNIDRPAGLIHNSGMRQYAVTFIDNHDTAEPHEGAWELKNNIEQANAVMLSAAGIPCVFWKHWTKHKSAIKQMIATRKAMGVNSNSDVKVTNKSGYYESVATGTKGTLICRIGSWSGTPNGYTVACSGNGWAYYTNKDVPNPPVPDPKPDVPQPDDPTPDDPTPSQSYAIRVNGTTNYPAEYKGTSSVDSSFEEYMASVQLNEGDTFVTYDLVNKAGWVMEVEPYGEYKNFEVGATSVKCKKAGCYDFYIKMKFQADIMYIGPGTNCGNTPLPDDPQPDDPQPDDPQPDDPIGPTPSLEEGYYIRVNGNEYYKANALGTTDMQGREQFMASVPLKAGDKFQCYDGGSGASWSIVTLEPYGAYQNFTAASVYSDPMVCNVAGCYDLYIKLMYENDTMYIGEGTDCSATPIKPTAIEEVNAVDLNIYPNPTNDYIKVDCAEDVNLVVIYSINGSEVIRTKSTYIDLSSLTPSLYFVNVMLQNGDVVRSKVIRK